MSNVSVLRKKKHTMIGNFCEVRVYPMASCFYTGWTKNIPNIFMTAPFRKKEIFLASRMQGILRGVQNH